MSNIEKKVSSALSFSRFFTYRAPFMSRGFSFKLTENYAQIQVWDRYYVVTW